MPAGHCRVPVTCRDVRQPRTGPLGPLERGDLRNDKDLARAFEAHRPWAVMHFAAYAYVGESTVDPAKYFDNNVGGTAKLLQACAAFGCKNFAFSSSCATYGIPERLPLTEEAPQHPVNPYGYTKLVVERMLKDAEAAYGIHLVFSGGPYFLQEACANELIDSFSTGFPFDICRQFSR
jgi:UDP-glucose 4-epimerase